MFEVLPHPTAYNGTNLTITGELQLDPNVDTPVTTEGMWCGDSIPQVTTVPPYQINRLFLPVATNSSGEYTMTYTICSSDLSSYIVAYNGTDSYSFTAIRKLLIVI